MNKIIKYIVNVFDNLSIFAIRQFHKIKKKSDFEASEAIAVKIVFKALHAPDHSNRSQILIVSQKYHETNTAHQIALSLLNNIGTITCIDMEPDIKCIFAMDDSIFEYLDEMYCAFINSCDEARAKSKIKNVIKNVLRTNAT